MKVLHLSAGNLYGGVETLLTTLARQRHLAPGMEPEFGLCFRGRQWDEIAATGVAVHDLGPVRISRPWTVWRARGRLRRVLADARPEVVVAHGPWPHAVFAPVVRRAGVRLVLFVHGVLTGRHWLERWAARIPPDLVLAHTRYTAGSAGAVFPGTQVEEWLPPVAPPAVDGPVRSEVRSVLGTADGAVVILQASRLERWKGQAVHLAALGLLRDVPGWECWLAGGAQKAGEAEFPWVSRHEETGLTVPVDDPAVFAAAARRLLEEPGLRDRLAAGARTRAIAEFQCEAMGRRSMALLAAGAQRRAITEFDQFTMAHRSLDIYRRVLASTSPQSSCSSPSLVSVL